MARGRPEYASYLLCLWRASEGGECPDVRKKTVWRASVESSLTGEWTGFATLEELFAFLRERTGERVGGKVDWQSGFLSYLLRLWREGGEGGGAWRASLEETGAGELKLFSSLDELFDYLRAQTGIVEGCEDKADCGARRLRRAPEDDDTGR
jgi:hypothetical protein